MIQTARVARRAPPPCPTYPRPFLVSSLLGIAWGLAHGALEARLRHKLSFGVPLTLAWAVALAWAVRGHPRATPLAVALGIAAGYWVAITHIGAEIPLPLDWKPWLRAELTGVYQRRDQVYDLVVCAGIVVGLANLWTVARVLEAWPRRVYGPFMLAVSGALLTAGLVSAWQNVGADADIRTPLAQAIIVAGLPLLVTGTARLVRAAGA